ncbi:MAG TPA: copper amine oxidase N-terminal domain-containing protein [Abditibacteriaceae bacterium]|jgi:hypothetical protein
MPYSFEGTPISASAEPQLKDGTMWVPLRSLASAMGANADWDSSNGVAILYYADRIVTIKIGDASIDVDGSPHQLQAAPYVDDGGTWVPVRLFSDVLGLNLNVDTSTKTVELSSPSLEAGSDLEVDPMGDPSTV